MKKNSLLGLEFDRYMREHIEFSQYFPDNSHIVLLLEGDEDFNKWSANLAKKKTEKGQPIVYITIKKLAPARSRIKELELATG